MSSKSNPTTSEARNTITLYSGAVRQRLKKRQVEALRKTRRGRLGGFDTYTFPIIRNVVENDVIDQIIAVQPLQGPVGQIVYMDIVQDGRARRAFPRLRSFRWWLCFWRAWYWVKNKIVKFLLTDF